MADETERVRRSLRCVVLGIALSLSAAPAVAQSPPPNTDVFIARMTVENGRIKIGAPINITARPGYDNQPAFMPHEADHEGEAVFYTSTRDDAQADIYRYDVVTKRTTRVTRTAPESEYSAAVLMEEQAIAVVRVEKDSTQRIWRVPLGGGESTVLSPGIKPVGYFAQLPEGRYGMFVLGRPNALVISQPGGQRGDTVARNIARSIQRHARTSTLTFVQIGADSSRVLNEVDPKTRQVTPIAKMTRDMEFHAWLPDGKVLVAQGSTLQMFDPSAKGEDRTWKTVADLSAHGVRDLSRLAISPKGDWIAFVATPSGSR
jgi:hypothetical protein